MFKSASLKLTAWYLALIMGLSLTFSVVLYNSSSAALRASFEHQRVIIRQQFENAFGFAPSLYDPRSAEIGEAQQRLIASLALGNTAVLVVAGAASFYLARRTLGPIEQAMEAQSRFTADASHELRTPLTAMQAEVEVALRDKNLSVHEARELLASNLEEVRNLQDLSNGLLALASQDQDHFAPQSVSVEAVTRQAISRIQKQAEQKDISIQNDVSDLHVLGDRGELVQLFVILLDNAIKYSPSGTTLTLGSTAQNGSAHISIADQGYGIKPHDLPHIFDRLYRADQSRTKDKVTGYGLGLSIAKKIVELHKGAIDVTSRVGEGSTFVVRLELSR